MTANEDLPLGASSCFRHFGYRDFDPARLKTKRPSVCPVADCSAELIDVRRGRGNRPFCPSHGLRLHSNTFVYWNGVDKQKEARLRNFPIRADLARKIALGSAAKAESYRLGNEMSEDALTWNVLVGLAEAGGLRQAVRFLTGREVDVEPSLYLWGELVDVRRGGRTRFRPLDAVRERLEGDIRGYKTEPDAIMAIEGQLVVCVEAKFGSGNPVAALGDAVPSGDKPTEREQLLRRYLDKAGDSTKRSVHRDSVADPLHSQIFRNVVFASEMADGCDWHVVNLVSSTQWALGSEAEDYSFECPEKSVHSYLHPDSKDRFSFRTWEGLHRELIKDDPALQSLDTYMRSKSAHYQRAFDLD